MQHLRSNYPVIFGMAVPHEQSGVSEHSGEETPEEVSLYVKKADVGTKDSDTIIFRKCK